MLFPWGMVAIDELALFLFAATRRRWLGGRSAGAQPAAFQNKRNQGEQDEKSGHVKKPVVMQVISRRTRRIAVAMSFAGVMMVLAHVSLLGRSISRCQFMVFLAALVGVAPMFPKPTMEFPVQ